MRASYLRRMLKAERALAGHAILPAAQYVRMSTDLQQYSIENQKITIGEYAERHRFTVIQTYSDSGKSGVVLKRRKGLSALLQDVMSGNARYKAVLVYDISRWGRFQDSDEAAHYEFLCKNSGIPVHYCAETFINDGTLTSAILKAGKRLMAGEFSRELGVKVFKGKSFLVPHGFRMGGPAGYGFRRLMLSAQLRPKQRLLEGEYKNLSTDRVTLIPGPKKEIGCVRSMYKMAIDERLGPTPIARRLNERGIRYLEGRPWNHERVQRILTNPKYAGWNVWNRTSQRLHTPVVAVDPKDWIVKQGAFPAIIDQRTFDRVQEIMRKKRARTSDKELLKNASRLLASEGRLSQQIIDRARNTASATTYLNHFGSLRRLYELIGYDPGELAFIRIERGMNSERLRDELAEKLRSNFPEAITISRRARGTRSRPILHLHGNIKVSLIIAPTFLDPVGRIRWRFEPALKELEHITLLCRLNSGNEGFHSFHVFKRIDKTKQCWLKENSPWLTTGTRLNGLSEFCEVAERLAYLNRTMIART